MELADAVMFALKRRPLDLPEKVLGILSDETRSRMSRLRSKLADHADWTMGDLESGLRSFAESEGVGLGKIGPALRGLLSGGAPAPDLAGALVSLGKAESLGRLDDALSPAA